MAVPPPHAPRAGGRPRAAPPREPRWRPDGRPASAAAALGARAATPRAAPEPQPGPGEAPRHARRAERAPSPRLQTLGEALGRARAPSSGRGSPRKPRPASDLSTRPPTADPACGVAFAFAAEAAEEARPHSAAEGRRGARSPAEGGGAAPCAGQGRGPEPAGAEGRLPQLSAAERGVLHVEELRGWALQACAHGVSPMAGVAMDVAQFQREWAVAEGQGKPWLDAAAGGEAMPRAPRKTAQAASLLLRLTRALPRADLLRGMLEQLAEELVPAIYRDWPAHASLGDLSEADLQAESIDNMTPYFALVAGHRCLREEAEARAEEEAARARAAVGNVAPLEAELARVRRELHAAEEGRAAAERATAAAEARMEAVEGSWAEFQRQTRTLLTQATEVRQREEMLQVEVRHLTLDKTRGEAKFKRLSEEFSKLSAEAKESEYKFASCRAKLQQKDVETIQMADLRAQLDRLKKNAILDGLDFAERIAREVFCKPTLEEACGEAAPNMPVAPKMPATNANVQRARVLLDVMVGILKGMRTEIQDHLRRIRELNQQLGGMRQLVPPWNLELAQDLENFYDVDAPIHRQIFSMKDQRSFAGLGTGEDVPKYLRAEGFVKHVFVSAATCQEFMSSFFRHFFSVEERPVRKSILDMSGREVQDLSTEAFHEELHIYLKQRFGGDGQAVTEFAYAFICSLEANRDDPDFELFDLILRGAVHPSIVKDEEELLRWLRTLLEDCQERYDPFNAAAEGSASGNRELVTRRTIAAVLKAIFPDKSPAQMDELRRATHATVEQLVAAAKAVGPDRVHVSDLFAQTADGTQSALIEEIRRQHYREVVRFAARMARQLSDRAQRKAAQAGDDGPLTVDSDTLRKVLQGLDATISRPPELDEAVRRVFPLAGQAGDQPQELGAVLRAVRRNTLLRPARLWLRGARASDVTSLLLAPPAQLAGAAPREGAAQGPAEAIPRCQALKVVDNPTGEARSAALDTEQGLLSALLPAPGQPEAAQEASSPAPQGSVGDARSAHGGDAGGTRSAPPTSVRRRSPEEEKHPHPRGTGA